MNILQPEHFEHRYSKQEHRARCAHACEHKKHANPYAIPEQLLSECSGRTETVGAMLLVNRNSWCQREMAFALRT